MYMMYVDESISYSHRYCHDLFLVSRLACCWKFLGEQSQSDWSFGETYVGFGSSRRGFNQAPVECPPRCETYERWDVLYVWGTKWAKVAEPIVGMAWMAI